MTIDERLEALTQSVELLSHMHQENESRMGEMMQAITRLSNIALVHDAEIADHEHRIGDLERPQ
jgi:hypothetical protein